MRPYSYARPRRDRELLRRRYRERGIQITLWIGWTLVVVLTAYLSWRGDRTARLALNLVGLLVHCSVAGVIGLVALTLIEMRLCPWRFLE